MVLDENLFEAMYTNISSSPYDLNIIRTKLDDENGRDWKYIKSFKFKDDAIERANRMIANGEAYIAQVYSWLDEDHGEIYFKKADDGKVIDKSVRRVDCKTHGPELRTRTDKTVIKPVREAKEPKAKQCIICKGPIIGYGNNAEPVKKGICCDECNKDVVIPFRFMQMLNSKKVNESAEGEAMAKASFDSKNANFEKDKETTREVRTELAKQGIATDRDGKPFTEDLVAGKAFNKNELDDWFDKNDTGEVGPIALMKKLYKVAPNTAINDIIDYFKYFNKYEGSADGPERVKNDLLKIGFSEKEEKINEGMFDNSVRYKGYDIEYNFYNEGEYIVQYQGDDVWFKSIDEAQSFIDEITAEDIPVLPNENAECECGNMAHTDGFHPCNKDGEIVEPDNNWEGCYKCARCGKIYVGQEFVAPKPPFVESKKLREDTSSKAYSRRLGQDTIQYFTKKNRFNYDVNQVRIDNKNKTYEFGSFKITSGEESTKNGKEFDRLIDILKVKGYTEIKDKIKESIEETTHNNTDADGKDALGYDTYKYGKYTIVHFPLDFELDGEKGHIESYLIQSPVKLSNSGYHLPLRAENEQGEEINFNTLEDVKAWIDKYDGKFKLQVKYGDEIHAVIKDEFKQIEESLTEDAAVVSLTSEQANENNGLSTILNTLIKDEFDAIQGYNDAIVNFETEGRGDLVQVLKDIVNEENLHVGQLEVLLEQVNGAANSIDQGKAEAETQLSTEGGEIVQESAKLKPWNENYRGYKIKLEDKGGVTCYNIYDKNGEMEDSGFKTVDDAKVAIDKLLEDPEEGMHY